MSRKGANVTPLLVEHPGSISRAMPDVQGKSDGRNVAIDKVGVKGVRYPITLRQACGGEQHTVALINLYVSLPKHKKGTHMSRFLEILNKHHRAITPEQIIPILHEMKMKLDAADAHIEMTFPYFIETGAPVTGAKGLMTISSWVCGRRPRACARARRRFRGTGRTTSGARSRHACGPTNCCGLRTW
jgi:GTP cyclohydrolase FolE2